jgi:hypothetical protein
MSARARTALQYSQHWWAKLNELLRVVVSTSESDGR